MTGKKPIPATTIHNRHSDTAEQTAKGYIARLAFMLTSLLIVLASLSLLFTGLVASREADRQASANQLLLLDLALENQFSLLARDQLSVARWDVSVMKISRNLDRNFIVNEFMDSLWYDFGIDQNLLIGPDNTVIAEAYRDEVEFSSRQLAATEPLYHLAEQARMYFSRHKEALSGGYGQKSPFPFTPAAAATHGFIVLDGQVALANGMAVIPDDGNAALPPGDPVVLVSAIHLNQKLLAGLNDQLSFNDLKEEILDAKEGTGMYSFDGGLAEIPLALARHLGSRLQTGTTVTEVRRKGEIYHRDICGTAVIQRRHPAEPGR